MTFGTRESATSKLPPPQIFARPLTRSPEPGSVQLLNEAQQAALLEIARVVDFRRHTIVYPEGGRAEFVYSIISGVVETYYLSPDGSRRIASFLFASDLVGLCENGSYVATAQALTPVVAYKFPLDALAKLALRDPVLDVAILCKLCHDLRQAERHVITAMKHDSAARVAAFVLWLWRSELPTLATESSVMLPMLRHDIADYLGMSHESVSRALLQLESSGLIRRKGARMLLLVDVPGLQRAAGEV